MIKSLYPIFQHWSTKGSVFIISDTHFDDNDCKLMDPKWISPLEHIEIIKKRVHKNDTLIVLGDVGNVEYFKLLNCYKVLITGNHDSGESKYRRKKECIITSQDLNLMRELKVIGKIDYIEKKDDYFIGWRDNKLFDEVYDGLLTISGKIILSHEPLPNLPFVYNIHGHDHSGRQYKDDNHLNVASNVINYTPVNLADMIKSGVLSKIDSIHRITIDKATANPLHKR